VSRARRLKKRRRVVAVRYLCHDGVTEVTENVYGPAEIRHAVNYEKRRQRDPFFLVAQDGVGAPVKYSRCSVCVGCPHHAPNVRKLDHLAWLSCDATDDTCPCSWFNDRVHRCCVVPFDDGHAAFPHHCMCDHHWPRAAATPAC
jgi:hypothetical protein